MLQEVLNEPFEDRHDIGGKNGTDEIWFADQKPRLLQKPVGGDFGRFAPKALRNAGVDIAVRYAEIQADPARVCEQMQFRVYYVDLSCGMNYCAIFTLEYDGVPFTSWTMSIISTGMYYGQYDDGKDYIFSRAF